MSPDELDAKVARTRTAQGLPPTVQDPATLERVAAVLRLITVQPAVPSQQPRRRKATVGAAVAS